MVRGLGDIRLASDFTAPNSPPQASLPMLRILLASIGTFLIASCAALTTGHSREMVYVVEASGGA